MYFKILNETECHNGLQYKTGINVDPLPWNPNVDCVPGGIYFASGDYIFGYIDNDSRYIREVKIPKDALVSHRESKSKASKVWLGKRRDLFKASTWRWMIDNGVNIHVWGEYALCFAAARGHLEMVKLLLEYGADVHAFHDEALYEAKLYHRIEVVKLLVDWIAKEEK